MTAAGAMRNGRADTLIILENDLYRRTQSKLVTDLLSSAKHVIAIDHLVHATTLKADIVLPAAAFAESSGSLVNNEGRAQRFYRVFLPEGQVRESWRWICDMMKAVGRPEAEKWHILDDMVAAMAATVPALSALPSVAPARVFGSQAARSRGKATATAAERRYGLRSMCTSIKRLKTRIRLWLSRWRVIIASPRQRLSPGTGHLAGIRCSPSINSRKRSGGYCAAAIRASALSSPTRR